jgi:hypothetical protein
MAWFWGSLILFLTLVLLVLVTIAKRNGFIEENPRFEEAQDFLKIAVFIFLFIGLIIFFLYQLFGAEYGYFILYITYAIIIVVWLLSWFFRKRKAGDLLLEIGKTEETEIFLASSIAYVALSGFMVWQLIGHILKGFPKNINLTHELPTVLSFLGLTIFYIAIGLSKLEFRENGICFMFRFYAWENIKFYYWKHSKPASLRLRYMSKFPLLPRILSLTMPVKYRDAVSDILNEKLPDNYL